VEEAKWIVKMPIGSLTFFLQTWRAPSGWGFFVLGMSRNGAFLGFSIWRE